MPRSENLPEPWYAEGLHFGCTRCGACCKGEGHVWVGEAEIEALAAHLDLRIEDFGRRYLRRVGHKVSLVDGPDGACVFWEEECTVYPVRPAQCRTFPFWKQNLRSEAAWNQVADESPGVNQGRFYGLEEIESLAAGEGETAGGSATGGVGAHPEGETD